jgi:hypothetical protein
MKKLPPSQWRPKSRDRFDSGIVPEELVQYVHGKDPAAAFSSHACETNGEDQ